MRFQQKWALSVFAALLAGSTMATAASRVAVPHPSAGGVFQAHGADAAAGDDHGRDRGSDNDHHRGGGRHGSLMTIGNQMEARNGADDAAKGHGGEKGGNGRGGHGNGRGHT